jgi:hypothetical protein
MYMCRYSHKYLHKYIRKGIHILYMYLDLLKIMFHFPNRKSNEEPTGNMFIGGFLKQIQVYLLGVYTYCTHIMGVGAGFVGGIPGVRSMCKQPGIEAQLD